MSSQSVHTTPADVASGARPADGGTLAALRSELDRVDDALHDALMRRAELVADVGALRAKGRVPLRPGREAAIIRRLLARNHGALDPALVVRVWREMLSGFTAQQREILVVVDDPALLPMVSAHFGLLTSVAVMTGAEAALARVIAGEATVAVLRWPGPWWMALLDGRAATLHVVARLPFWGMRSGVEAMVLTEAPPDPSGDDRTLIGAALAPSDLRASLGTSARIVAGDAAGPSLVEVDGFVGADDPLLAALPGRFSVLGAFATQLGVIE